MEIENDSKHNVISRDHPNFDCLMSIKDNQKFINALHHEIFELGNYDPQILQEYNLRCMEMVDKMHQIELKLGEETVKQLIG